TPSLQRHYPPSSVLLVDPTPCRLFALPPFVRLSGHTPVSRRRRRVSRVTCQSLCHSCHGLRPRRRVCSLAFAVAALLTSVVSKTSSSSISHISGLYPFNLSACGLCACLPTLKVGDYSPSSKAGYPVAG